MSSILQRSKLSPQDEAEALKTPTKGKKVKQMAVVTPEQSSKSSKRGIKKTDIVEADSNSRNNGIVTPTKSVSEDTRTLTPNRTRTLIEPVSLKKEFQSESDEKPSIRSSTLHISKEVDKCYKLVRKATGALGGNGHTGAIYGELTMHSMQRVTNYLVEYCGLGPGSRFIDIGSGLGKPNFHVAQSPGVRLSLGIELEELRWKLAMHNLLKVLPYVRDDSEDKKIISIKKGKEKSKPAQAPAEDADGENCSFSSLLLNGGVNFIAGDIDIASSTDPFTHIYQFDLGFPPPLQQSIARKFNSSMHAKYLISYRPPHRVISEYGYAVDFMDQLMTSMHGSGEGHMAYVYKRNNSPPPAPEHPETQQRLVIPGRPNHNKADKAEEDVEVYCDNAWAGAVKLAVGPRAELVQFVRDINIAHLDSGRPVRKRTGNLFLADI